MILNESMLRHAADEAKQLRGYDSFIQESVHYDAARHYDLFISHSFKDQKLVIGLYHLFKKCGYKVYIDWIDDKDLDRENITEETAKLIKERISQSDGASYIATSNSTNSKWCPWELGVADGLKGRVCILPVMEGNTFKGQEYLGLYPYLEFDRTSDDGRKEFWVHDQNNWDRYATLRYWLNNDGNLIIH